MERKKKKKTEQEQKHVANSSDKATGRNLILVP